MKKNIPFIALILVLVLLPLAVITVFGKLLGGAFRFILGVLVILALVVIVIWMFAYAGRHR